MRDVPLLFAFHTDVFRSTSGKQIKPCRSTSATTVAMKEDKALEKRREEKKRRRVL